MTRILPVCLALAACATVPAATVQPAGSLRFENAIVRSTSPGSSSTDVAAYVAIRNDGPEDRLVGVSCTCAERVEIHQIARPESAARGDLPVADLMAMSNRMTPAESLPVPARGSLEIRPGSDLHLMLMGTRGPLVEGETVELVLQFQRAGAVNVRHRITEDTRAAWVARR